MVAAAMLIVYMHHIAYAVHVPLAAMKCIVYLSKSPLVPETNSGNDGLAHARGLVSPS